MELIIEEQNRQSFIGTVYEYHADGNECLNSDVMKSRQNTLCDEAD